MSASTEIISYHKGTNGNPSAPDSVNVQGLNVRHRRSDADTADLENPVPIPATGTAYGWRKHTKVRFTSMPVAQCSNLLWYMEAIPQEEDPSQAWDGISIYAGITSAYVVATALDENAVISGVQPGFGNAVGVAKDCDLAPAFDINTPMHVAPDAFIGRELGVGLTQPFVVTQMSVNNSAVSGEKASRFASYRYVEV